MTDYDLEELPTAYAWFHKIKGKPVSSKCITGDENYLWDTEEDAYQFMKEYMMAHGITDLDNYRQYELTVTGVRDGEDVMGFSEASKILEGEDELEPPQQKLESDGGEK